MALSERLRFVKVCCGDWSCVCGGNWQAENPPCGIFFDPPYGSKLRKGKVYEYDCSMVSTGVEKYVLGIGENKNIRIVVCGYEGEYEKLIQGGWRVIPWKAGGGYRSGTHKYKDPLHNRLKERLFLSPHCLFPENDLFAEIGK